MAGFIVLEDGRAYAASNWATDATIRAVARSVGDESLRAWLLAQQSEQVGMGMTSVDLRELAPQTRQMVTVAIRDAHARVCADEGFEQLRPGNEYAAGWLAQFGDLVEMLDRSEAGEPPENFNPHMRALIPPRGGKVGPGWGEDAAPPSL